MPPTRQEYLEYMAHQESIGKPYVPSIDTALGMLKTAAVSFEHLTNDEHWDRFLSYIQKMLDEAKEERQVWLDRCGNIGADDALRSAQLMFKEWDGRVKVLNEVISLPSRLRLEYDAVRKT